MPQPGLLGKLPARKPYGLADLTSYAIGRIPEPPPTFEPPNITDYGMLGNDMYGDCTIAGCAHLIMAQNAFCGTNDPAPNTAQVEQQYFEITGGQDSGCVEADVLKLWRQEGLWGNKIDGYAPVNEHKVDDLCAAIAFYGGAYLGVEMPDTAQQQFANGEPWKIVRGAQIVGGHCVVPSTKVLTADLDWAPIGDILPGDLLVGFDEVSPPGQGQCRQFRTATVEAVERLRLPCYELEFEDGTKVVASYDHMWLVDPHSAGSRRHDPMKRWLTTEQLRPMGPSGKYGTKVTKLFDTWDRDLSWGSGFLAAAFDGEGWIDGNERNIHKVGYCQRENPMLAQTIHELKEREYSFRQYLHNSKSGYSDNPVTNIVIGRREQTTRFLGSIRPPRLLDLFSASRLGMVKGRHTRLISKTFVGEQEVVAVQTDTRTYLAEGMCSHNCIVAVGYDHAGIHCVTWGALATLTWPWLARYCSEAWAVISAEAVEVGHGPRIDLAAMRADLDKWR